MRNPVLVSRWWLVVVARSAFGCLLGCAVRSSWAVRGRLGWGRLRAVFGALVVSLCVVVVAAPASAFVYWANPSRNTIGLANLDGTCINRSFITGANGVYWVAVDGQHVYWTNNTVARSAGRTSTVPTSIRAFSPASATLGSGRRRPAHLLDRLQPRHDRPGEPRRHRCQSELHRRRRCRRRGGG